MRDELKANIMLALQMSKNILREVHPYADDFTEEVSHTLDQIEIAEKMFNANKVVRNGCPSGLPDTLMALRTREPRKLFDDQSADHSILISSAEREQICNGFGVLLLALEPFSHIKAPSRYSDDSYVAVEITGDKNMAEQWAAEWDARAAAGNKPAWARPDIARGTNYPTEVLALDEITMADIRYAQEVIEIMKPNEMVPEQQGD